MKADRSARIAASGAALVLAVAALAGCGGGGGSSSSGGSGGSGASSAADASAAKPPKACSLFTKKLAQSELGKAVKLTINHYDNPLLSQCNYTGTKGFVNVMSGPWSQVSASAANGKAVSGFGDQAISAASGLAVRKGTLGIDIDSGITGSYSGAAATKVEKLQLASEKRLAKKLVAGL